MSKARGVMLSAGSIAMLLALPVSISASNESKIGLAISASNLCAEETGCP